MGDVHGGNIYRYPFPILDFSANINPLGVPPRVKKVITERIDLLVNYPDPEYIAPREAASRYCGVAWKHIIPGNGATEMIFHIFRALKPDRVLAPVPLFSEYERAALLSGVEFVPMTLDWRNGFSFSSELLFENLEKTRAQMLILCNPNNPTGKLLDAETMKTVMRLAGQFSVTVVVDETFIEFTEDYPNSSVLSFASDFDNVVVLRALTKFFALPGLRAGYAWVGSDEMLAKLWLTKEPWSVNQLAAWAMEVVFDDDEYISASRKWIREERAFFSYRLSQFNDLLAFPPAANFILCRIIRPDLDAARLQSLLLQDGILIRNASNFRGLDSNFIRLAIKKRDDNERLLASLGRYLK